jgi:glycosyltransferase involved in cell wall biosynthesis
MKIGIDVSVLREKVRGVGNYLINILKRFPQYADNDRFFLYSPRPIIYQLLANDLWHNRNGTIPLPGSFWLQAQGARYIKNDKIEVFFSPAHIIPLNLPKPVRIVLAVHDLVSILYPETMADYNRFVHNLFFKTSVKKAHHIITMSEYTKHSLIDYFNIDKERITEIYEGVGDTYRPYYKAEIKEILARYKLTKPYILSVGTLEPRKNYLILLEAYKNLNIDYDLVIIGKEGWKAKAILEKIHRLKLEDKVKILGYTTASDLPYLYNGAGLFVFPSVYEGFGLPLLEALACGVPTVCSNSSSLPEVGGDAVVYFDPNSAEELKIKIAQILNDNQLQKLLKEKSLIQAKKFNWDNTAQKTLSLLKG